MARKIDCLVLNVPGECNANCKFCYLKKKLGKKWVPIDRMEEELRFTAKTLKHELSDSGTLLLSMPHNDLSIQSLTHNSNIITSQLKDTPYRLGIISLNDTMQKYSGTFNHLIEVLNPEDIFLSVVASKLGNFQLIHPGEERKETKATFTLNLIIDSVVTRKDVELLIESQKKAKTRISEVNISLPMIEGMSKHRIKLADTLGKSLEVLWKFDELNTYVSACTRRMLLERDQKGRATPCYASICGYAEIIGSKLHRECPYGVSKECGE